jgi:hypothetical protein
MTNDYIYDIETYPNVFTMAVEHAEHPLRWSFEISPWRNDSSKLIDFFTWLKMQNARMAGFNNLGFDYPVVHTMIRMGHATAETLYAKAQAIFQSSDTDDRWVHGVRPDDRFVEQIDLFKIHHFDNKARSTSLKALEFNMRLKNVSDLPFPPGTPLDREQTIQLKQYNAHDVTATKRFYHETRDMIRFREEMCQKYPGKDWLNFNDTKIGKEYFILRLEQAGVSCYNFGPDGRTPRQTPRPVINLADAILPWITFEQPEFNRVLHWLKQQSITETKGVFTDLTATVAGFDFVFGLGGIHGSVENRVVESDDDNVVIDLDVASYYPNLAIANDFYPAHLGKSFAAIYKDLYEQRKGYAKGTAENAMLKLALNGVYGDSNNRFSVFYDPLYTMTITLNGQLLLCLLAEQLIKIPQTELVQINTDGLTIRTPRVYQDHVNTVVKWWEGVTKLQLEAAEYKSMMIADVNSYVAVYQNGKVKRKGRYEYNVAWHQNASALVVPKVAEKVLIEGAPIRQTIEQWPDIMDFMLRVKVPRSSHLLWGEDKVQNTTRYYVAKGGKSLTKVMPPLKGKTEWRRINVESGWAVQVCNDMDDAVLPVDFDWYVQETEKLCLSLA